jgi:glycosyltransferase involved in cell wall biosynthesis
VKVLLLSAYDAASHAHWQRSLLLMLPDWQWQVLTLPPRHFSWRIRGNPLYWSLSERAVLEDDYDLLVATSMVDLATLRGLVPALARLPSLLYFHENQFDYPQRSGQHSLVEAQMVSLYSALAADSLAFNSAYNRDTFLAGVEALLKKLPDRVPDGVSALLAGKATVLPVPIDIDGKNASDISWPGAAGCYPQRPLRLLWSGRFEHDKGGDALWDTLAELEGLGLDYELAMTGQQFRSSPSVFGRIESEFSHRLVQFGYLPDISEYRALLRNADVVLSTAQHEFQGLAVLEAVASGCLPAVPDRQAYTEMYPREFRYPCHGADAKAEAVAAAGLVRRLAAGIEQGDTVVPDLSLYGLRQLQGRYEDLLQSLVDAPG